MYNLSHIIGFIALFLLCSCSQNEEKSQQPLQHNQCNSIYYWKTVYNPDSTEIAFLQQHNVKRMYIRFFDVDIDWSDYHEKPIPIATVQIRQTFPDDMEIVPTVFITNESIKYMAHRLDEYTEKMVTRILAMLKGNKIKNVSEVQFDCDWTKSTKDVYFKMLELLNKKLKQENIGISATIRLHQLSQQEPPIDRGVLMLYNTGGIKNPDTQNSILNIDDVKPYFNNNIDYNLPLDFAYPTYAWAIWFRDGKFKAILRTTDFSDTTHFVAEKGNCYRVTSDVALESHLLKKGDIIRLENSDIQEILAVKDLVESKLIQTNHSTIIYHLNSKTLSKYSKDEINSIYSYN